MEIIYQNNIEKDDISKKADKEDVERLNTVEAFLLTFNSDYITNEKQACYKIGNRICISFAATTKNTLNTNTKIATIPERFRPNKDLDSLYGVFFVENFSYPFHVGAFAIRSGAFEQRVSSIFPADHRIGAMLEYYLNE